MMPLALKFGVKAREPLGVISVSAGASMTMASMDALQKTDDTWSILSPVRLSI